MYIHRDGERHWGDGIIPVDLMLWVPPFFRSIIQGRQGGMEKKYYNCNDELDILKDHVCEDDPPLVCFFVCIGVIRASALREGSRVDCTNYYGLHMNTLSTDCQVKN